LTALLLTLSPALVLAQNARVDTGYSALAIQLGAALPTGAGVAVTQVEATQGGNRPSNTTAGTGTFAGKTFTFRSPASTASGHAITVGNNYYGNGIALAPGITTIDSYEAGNWIGSGILKAGQLNVVPQATLNLSRVANHSYIGNGTVKNAMNQDVFNISATLDILQRTDFLVERDDLITVVGMNNGANGGLVSTNGTRIGSNMDTLLSYAANTISVGVSSLAHVNGTPRLLDGLDVYGRGQNDATSQDYREHPRPDLVAPAGATSFSTPLVASAAALLIDASRTHVPLSVNPLSADPWSTVAYEVRYETAPGTKYQVYAADTSEVIRAALMAGADRKFFNSDGVRALDYRGMAANQSPNGLDRRYGAGQLNVRNSYDVLAGKQQAVVDQPRLNPSDPLEAIVGLATVPVTGFDYDQSFGGENDSNSIAKYNFTGSWTGQTFTASLVWNVGIDTDEIASYDPSQSLFNLNLRLLNVTNPLLPFVVATSASDFENTENIFTNLQAGQLYQLEVTTPDVGSFEWDYGLAWNGSSNQVWLGTALNNTWNVQTMANGVGAATWQRGNYPASTFLNNDQVVFTDLAVNKVVNITAPVTPDFVTVNSTADYTFGSDNGSGITGPGGLFKQGTGTLFLNTTNTYTGGTYISAGRLAVNGSISGPVDVQLAGTLGGNGTVNGNVSGSGTVAPGNSIGTLHIAGTYNITGMNDFEISKLGSALSSDLVDQITTLTYGGTLKITSFAGSDASTTYVPGNSWDLFDFPTNSFSGQFANNNDFGIFGGGGNLPLLDPQYAWSFEYSNGVLSVIPEPTTWAALLSVGVFAWGAGRKKRMARI